MLASVPFDMAAFATATGQAGAWGEAGYSVLERMWTRPTLDVNGLWSGWTGAGAKTVIPARAGAKVSMRLVPDQEPGQVGQLFRDHLARVTPAGVTVTVRELHGARPALVDRSLPAVAAAAAALEMAFGRPAVFAREGGTIPVVSTLHDVLGLPTVLMGLGLPDDNPHAPDEKLDLDNFGRGIEASIAFAEQLGRGAL